MAFQIHALPYAPFAPLFAMSDAELAARRARRVTADAAPGFPCRVSLADAEPGETLVLLHYEHQPADSPYRASHAIFVRENAVQAFPEAGTVPKVLRRRLISVRAFDSNHDMVAAEVVDGTSLATAIESMFGVAAIAYLHLHNAKPGCFAASVTRS